MTVFRLPSGAVLAGLLGAVACNGSLPPANPPSKLVVNSGGGQSWYFNNPLPVQLSVQALDADNAPVAGVVVKWAVTSGTGGVSPAQSTTTANGVAIATDSLGTSTVQQVTATLATGTMATANFTEAGTAAPTAIGVSLQDNLFSPTSVVVQTGGTVTWTWGGVNLHNLTFTAGPDPLPANQSNQSSGTAARTITILGKYDFKCTNHPGMSGSVTVVH